MQVLHSFIFFPRLPRSTLFPYTTLFRSGGDKTHRTDAARLTGNRRHVRGGGACRQPAPPPQHRDRRSEEHTSELQSRLHLVCRLLLEKKQNIISLTLWTTAPTGTTTAYK